MKKNLVHSIAHSIQDILPSRPFIIEVLLNFIFISFVVHVLTVIGIFVISLCTSFYNLLEVFWPVQIVPTPVHQLLTTINLCTSHIQTKNCCIFC